MVKSGDYLDFGRYDVVYVAIENSGQAKACAFRFYVLCKHQLWFSFSKPLMKKALYRAIFK